MAGIDRFIGCHEVTIDLKGRIHLPAKFREILVNVFDAPLVLTIGANRALVGYPAKEWVEKYEALEAEPFSQEKGRKLRLVSAYANEVPLKNGRILIPQRLREYAELTKEAVVVGRMKKIEIWSQARFKEAINGASDDEVAAELSDLGF